MIRSKTSLRAWLIRVSLLLAAATVIPACGRALVATTVPYSISNATLASGVVGVAYTETLTAASATGAVTWSIFAGSLPAGLTLNPVTGQITGVPTSPGGTAVVLVRAVDAAGQVTQHSFLISITGGVAGTLTVTTSATLPGGDVGVPYDFGFSALNGAPPFAWSVTSGALPPGIVLNAANGGLIGVPTAAGTFLFTIHAGDTSVGNFSVACSLTIASPMQITAATMPPGSVGGAYSQPSPVSAGSAPFLYSISAGTLPAGLSLNPATGVISGTPTLAATSGYTIRVTDAAGVSLLAGITHVINPAPIVTPVVLPPSTQGLAYSQTLAATLGTGAYSWTVTGGALPGGLSLSAGGAITGTSTVAGTFPFTVTVTDAANGTGSLGLSILINPPVTVSAATLNAWTVNQGGYSQTIAASGGTGTRTFSVTGSLPTGLTLNPATGVISGTPTATGIASFSIVATDSLGATGSNNFSITINLQPSITTTTLPDWTQNFAYTPVGLGTLGGTVPFGWSVTVGTLPTGLSVGASTGIVGGTPTGTGSSTFTITLVDASGASTFRQYTVVINPALSISTGSPLSQWTQNFPGYSQTLVVGGGTGVTRTWSAGAGLPAGLSLSAAGVVSGTPTGAPNLYTFTATVTDTVGASTNKSFDITINPPVTITTASPLAAWTRTLAGYNQTVAASGGTGTKVWSNPGGGLPAGLALNTANGAITGTPTAAATSTFNIAVADGIGASTGAQSFSITINPVPAVTAGSLLPWTKDHAGYSQTVAATGGTGALTFSNPGGGMPTGLVLSGAGAITGTPTVAGTFTFNVVATDTLTVPSPAQSFSITINPVPSVTAASLPAWTQSFSTYSQTIAATGGTGALTFSNPGGGLPGGLSLNSSSGAITGTPNTPGTFTFNIVATDTLTVPSPAQSFSITINPPPSFTTTSPLPQWTQNLAGYSKTIVVAGGTGTLAVTNPGGGLPAGLTLTAGLISGTPTGTGTSTFNLQLTDSLGATTGPISFSITINPPPSITTVSPLAPWTKDHAGYSQTLAATGGTGALTWSVSTGSLPSGLALNPSTGAITGTPDTVAVTTFDVTAKDTLNVSSPAVTLSITINPIPAVTASSLAAWTQNLISYSQTVAATGGTGTLTFSNPGGGMPNGLTLSGAGAITGTPTVAGTFVFNVRATDSLLVQSPTQSFSITINPPLVVTTSSLADWTQFQGGYSQTLLATGGTGTRNWSITSGLLPVGLTLAPSTGIISGTPTGGPSTYTVFVQVSDSVGATSGAAVSESMTLNPPLSFNGPFSLQAWTTGRSGYGATTNVSGGTGTKTWSNPGGGIPAGLSLDSSTGQITGSPSALPNTYSFQIKVTDNVGASSQQGFSIAINPAVAITTGATLPDGALSIGYSQAFNLSGGTAPFNWTSSPLTPVPGLTFSNSGVLSGTPTTGGSFSFSVTVTDLTGSSSTVNPVNLFILAPLTVTTASLPNATASTAYTPPPLTATGGRSPYTWSVLSGTLPGTILLNGIGSFSGNAPANNGTASFVLKVTDADNRTATQALSITTTGGAVVPLSIDTVSLNDATQGSAYNAGLAASGGNTGSYQWTISVGSLPSGLGLGLSSGIISGTPTATAPSFTVQLFDGATTVTKSLSITVNPPLLITTGSPLPEWTINRGSYTGSLIASGGSGGNTWTLSSGAPPPGMTLTTGGTFSGSPTVAGPAFFTVQVTDVAGGTATKSFQLTVNNSPSFPGSGLPSWDKDLAGYSTTPSINNGTLPITWVQTGGTMPPGLSIASNGLITGTPTSTGSFGPQIQATDAAGAVVSQTFNLSINLQPSISTGATLPQASEGQAYNQSVSGQNGSGSLSFSMTAGSLPAGVSFSGNTFSGTPGLGSFGTYNPKITVTDAIGGSGFVIFTLVVTNGPAVASSNPPDALAPTVNTDTNLVLTFNTAMKKAEVQANFSLATLAGSPVHQFFWDTIPANPDGTVMTVVFDTAAPFGTITGDDLLADNATYTWTISSGAHNFDLSQVMPVQTGQFRTKLDSTPPSLLSVSPNPAAAVLSNVTLLTLTFNEPMDQSTSNGRTQVQVKGGNTNLSANAGASGPPMSVQWTDSTHLAIGFSPALPGNTGYRVQIQSLFDANDNQTTSNVEFSLLTSGSLTNPPLVTANFPPAGATGVNRDASIFIALSEPVSLNVITAMTIMDGATPLAANVRYKFGDGGPLGVQATPVSSWPANKTITVTIPTSVTNAGGTAFASAFTFQFTTGANGSGTNAIVIDDPFSSLKNGTADASAFGGGSGELLFKDSVSGNRVFLDSSTTVNSAISVVDPNGIPVKNYVIQSSGEPGRSIQIGSRSGQGVTGLQFGTTYTMTLKGTITGSTGQSFAATDYTFTTVASSSDLAVITPDFNDFQANTLQGAPPTRQLDVKVNINNGSGGGTNIVSVAAHVGSTTAYTVGFVPGWIIVGSNVTVSGCLTANNGNFQVTNVSGNILTLNNSLGVVEGSPSGNAQLGPQYGIALADVTAGNTFSKALTLNNGNFQYSSSGDETGIVTNGDHTFRYTVTDGIPAHTTTVDTSTYFFSAAELNALTLTATSPAGGALPVYTWTGTAPASVTVLFLSVQDSGGNDLFGWLVDPSVNTFTQPDNFPLPAGSYKWTIGYFHSQTGTIRDQGDGNGQLTPVSFTR